jgi:hypothetical protein
VNKRKLQVLILAAALVFVFLIWVLYNPSYSVTDEGKYREWQRTIRTAGRIMSLERHLPQGLSGFFGLPNLEEKYVDTHSALGGERE